MNSVRDWFNQIYEKRVSPVPLGVFRIIYGISLLIEVVHLIYFRQLFMDPVPFLEPHVLPMLFLLLIWAVVVFLITLGYQLRMAAIVNFVFCVIFLGFGSEVFSYEWHVDSLILSGALLLLFIPADRALSLRHWLERKSGNVNEKPVIRYIYPVLLMLLIGGIYLDSIFWKLTSEMYLNGLALWAPASLPFNIYFDIQWILDFEILIYAASITVLLYETLFIFFVWFKGWRTLLITLGVIFHIAIGIAFPLPAFGLIMVGFLLGGMPVRVFAKALKVATGKEFNVHYSSDEQADENYKKRSERVIETHRKGIAVWGRFQKGIIVMYLIFWFVSLVIIHFRSPFYITYAGDMESLWGDAYKAGAVYKKTVYPFTGFSTHGLYVDSHFRDYTYQIRLVYNDKDGEREIPVIRENGMAGIYNVGRNHIYWTFRTSGTAIPDDLMETRLKRFILFWIYKNEMNNRNVEIDIFTRPLKVSLNEFSEGRLHENINQQWEYSGRFFIDDSIQKFEWVKSFR